MKKKINLIPLKSDLESIAKPIDNVNFIEFDHVSIR